MRLRWKTNGMKTTTPGGKTKLGREYFRVCDLGLKGKKLIQPSITSALKTPSGRQEDTNSNLSFVTPSVGQNTSEAQTDGMAGIIPDEAGLD